MKLEFSPQFYKKNSQIKNFMKIRPARAELFHLDRRTDRLTDGRTDTTKLTVAFQNFANAPKDGSKL